jgi:hypothetical protein
VSLLVHGPEIAEIDAAKILNEQYRQIERGFNLTPKIKLRKIAQTDIRGIRYSAWHSLLSMGAAQPSYLSPNLFVLSAKSEEHDGTIELSDIRLPFYRLTVDILFGILLRFSKILSDAKIYVVTGRKSRLGQRVEKAIVGIGVFALIIGILLIAFPFVYVPKTTSEAYQVPKSKVLIGAWGPLAFLAPTSEITEGTYLNAGDSLNIQVNVTSGKEIDFSVNDGSTTYLSYSRVTTVNEDWTVPQSSNYNFVFNSSSTFWVKDVTWQVTKHWTDTAYRDVTQNVQLLPFEFAYLGVALALVGLGLTIYGVVKKEIPDSPSL